jgi:hypothetical protein
MKPRLFIGSSREALPIAEAIHQALTREAECTVWKDSFPIGGTTLGSLMNTMRRMDFAVFVFAPDDITELRGDRYLVARDNVLYELGLFTGHLSPQRCFFVLPDNIRVHIPTDLAGVTNGVYEAGRTDGNMTAAVGPFCSHLKQQITAIGFAQSSVSVTMHELAVQFECADWVEPMDAKVQRKLAIVREMIGELKRDPADKWRLRKQDRVGFKVLLAAAIQANPSTGDDELILSVNAATVPRGVAQRTMVEAIIHLESAKLIAPARCAPLASWLGKLLDVDSSLTNQIDQLQIRLR